MSIQLPAPNVKNPSVRVVRNPRDDSYELRCGSIREPVHYWKNEAGYTTYACRIPILGARIRKTGSTPQHLERNVARALENIPLPEGCSSIVPEVDAAFLEYVKKAESECGMSRYQLIEMTMSATRLLKGTPFTVISAAQLTKENGTFDPKTTGEALQIVFDEIKADEQRNDSPSERASGKLSKKYVQDLERTKNELTGAFGTCILANLKGALVNNWVKARKKNVGGNGREKAEASPRYKKNIRDSVLHLLKQCAGRFAPRNWDLLQDIKTIRVGKPVHKHLTEEEVIAIIHRLDECPEEIRTPAGLVLLAGVRPTDEVHRLRGKHVHMNWKARGGKMAPFVHLPADIAKQLPHKPRIMERLYGWLDGLSWDAEEQVCPYKGWLRDLEKIIADLGIDYERNCLRRAYAASASGLVGPGVAASWMGNDEHTLKKHYAPVPFSAPEAQYILRGNVPREDFFILAQCER